MPLERIHHEVVRVGPESIDIQEHVNNREYLRWMELAAINHAEKLGWGVASLVEQGRAWVAREHWIEYLRPCFAGDELDVYTWIQSIHGPTSLRRYAVVRGGLPVAVGATEWVYLDRATGRPTLINPGEEVLAVLVAPTDPELKRLGAGRPVRFSPGAALLKGEE